MKLAFARTSIPSTRVAMMRRYVDALRSMGAPVERLLVRAGIPPNLLDRPSAAVPLPAAFRFGELACLAAGTEHLGLYVGLLTTLDELGVYGRTLKSADTLHAYLRRGMSLYNILVTGQRLWLSEHGEDLRLNIVTVGEPGIGPYQSHLSTLVVTIAKCREIAGPDWSPKEVSLAYRPRETFPDVHVFGQSQVALGTGHTYCTIPRALLGRCFPLPGTRTPVRAPRSFAERPLPRTHLDINAARITSVIWATGYEFDFGWVQLLIFDSRGAPAQYRGAAALLGFHFLGLPWMHKSKSSFLYGVGEDAAYIASRIADEQGQSAGRR